MRALAFALLLCLAAPQARAEAPKSGDHFGDWIFTCRALGPGQTECGLAQTISIKSDKGQGRILSLYLQRRKIEKERKLVLYAIVPLGIYLPTGVAARVDKGEQFPLLVRTCTAGGCEAVTEIDDAKLAQLKAGQTLAVGFKPNAQGKTYTVPASLKGITKGLEALP